MYDIKPTRNGLVPAIQWQEDLDGKLILDQMNVKPVLFGSFSEREMRSETGFFPKIKCQLGSQAMPVRALHGIRLNAEIGVKSGAKPTLRSFNILSH